MEKGLTYTEALKRVEQETKENKDNSTPNNEYGTKQNREGFNGG